MASTRKHTRSRHFVASARRTSDRDELRLVVHTTHHGDQCTDDAAALQYATNRFVAAMTPGKVKRGLKVKSVIPARR